MADQSTWDCGPQANVEARKNQLLGARTITFAECAADEENKGTIHWMDVCPMSSSLEPVVFVSRTGGEFVVAIELPRGNWPGFECNLSQMYALACEDTCRPCSVNWTARHSHEILRGHRYWKLRSANRNHTSHSAKVADY